MEDKLIEILENARKRLDIHPERLCRGICSVELYYLLLREECSMDRVTVKRLLARLGVDNGNYEHYLEYEDYSVWRNRMCIINAIEKQQLNKARELIGKYKVGANDGRNISRKSVDEQFVEFVKLQIIRHEDIEEYEKVAKECHKEALKITMPELEQLTVTEWLLSPVEFNLLLEYRRREVRCSSQNELMKFYEDMFLYLDSSNYNQLSVAKIYPKTVACMYQDIKEILGRESEELDIKQCEGLWKYCDKALSIIKDRKMLYYMVELLDMAMELLAVLQEKGDSDKYKNNDILKELAPQLDTLKELYEEYNESAYMCDDCYLYRESGIYCIPDVIKIRRQMKGMTQKELCENICSIKTLSREENKLVAMQRYSFERIFERLGLYPNYINMGIVTNKKEAIDIYEELRFAGSSFDFDNAMKLVANLKLLLGDMLHPINNQVLGRIESYILWSVGEISTDTHVENLKNVLGYTIDIKNVYESEKIFLAMEELETLYLLSVALKESGNAKEAYKFITPILMYCEQLEEEALEDGRIGVYELIMGYMSNLLGDMEEYKNANEMADKLIKLSLRLRRNMEIHQSLYSKAWNNNECKKENFDYNHELHRCIYLSQLTRDRYDEEFYFQQLI